MNLGDLIEKVGNSSEKEIKFDEPVQGGLIEFEFIDDGDHGWVWRPVLAKVLGARRRAPKTSGSCKEMRSSTLIFPGLGDPAI